jgi:hypothetical protein
MFIKRRQIDPAVRRALDDIGEDMVRAKLPAIMNVTSLRSAAIDGRREELGIGEGEQLGENLRAPLWAIQQWLAEKDARRQRWVQAAAILAGLAVLVALLAWFFPITDQRPELASTGGNINIVQAPKVATLQWSNIGTKPARRADVTLFVFNNGKRQTELGKGNITGSGTNIIPHYNGDASITFDKELGDELLACVTYLGDDDKKYEQAFVYDQEAQQNGIKLSELARPRSDAVCR